MKKLFWNLYYKHIEGLNVEQSLKNAKLLAVDIQSSTKGNIGHFYNSDGVNIRGWERNKYNSRVEQHPLIKKYC